jgi:hypothetical protein
METKYVEVEASLANCTASTIDIYVAFALVLPKVVFQTFCSILPSRQCCKLSAMVVVAAGTHWHFGSQEGLQGHSVVPEQSFVQEHHQMNVVFHNGTRE